MKLVVLPKLKATTLSSECGTPFNTAALRHGFQSAGDFSGRCSGEETAR